MADTTLVLPYPDFVPSTVIYSGQVDANNAAIVSAINTHTHGDTRVVTDSPYSADPTGATNAVAAINQAILDAYNAGGGTVLIPAGTFLCQTTINHRAGVSIAGVGWASVLKFDYALQATNQATYIQNVDQTSGSTVSQRMEVRDLKILGANDAAHNPMGVDGGPWGTATVPSLGILFRRTSYTRVHGCWFDRIPGFAVAQQGGSFHATTNNVFTRCGRGGVDLRWYTAGSDGDTRYEHITCSHNQMYFMGDDGIALNSDVSIPGSEMRSSVTIPFATTAGSTTVTTPSAPARPFAVGDLVAIPGADEFAQDFNARIASINTTTSVVLDDAPGQTISSATTNITGATNATPIVITAVAHGLQNGAQVLISGVGGNTAANGTWIILRLGLDTFSLKQSAGNGAYTSGGTVVSQGTYGTIRPRHVSICGNTYYGLPQVYSGTAGAGKAYGRGIYIRGSENVVVSGNTIQNSPYSGILVSSEAQTDFAYGTGCRCNGIVITGNTLRNCAQYSETGPQPRHGIYVLGANNLAITDNTVDRSYAVGIEISNVRGFTIGDNVVAKNGLAVTDYGIYVNGYTLAGVWNISSSVVEGTVSGNTVRRNAGGGIRVMQAPLVEVNGNMVTDNGNASTGGAVSQAGIILDGDRQMSAVGNTCTDTRSSGKTQSWGIRLEKTIATASNPNVKLIGNELVGNINDPGYVDNIAGTHTLMLHGNRSSATVANVDQYPSAQNLVLDTTTGLKVGTATSQKLGFWNVTPVVQPGANADTSGATLPQLETEVNELKALLRTLGLMAP